MRLNFDQKLKLANGKSCKVTEMECNGANTQNKTKQKAHSSGRITNTGFMCNMTFKNMWMR